MLAWNEKLRQAADAFSASHLDASVVVWSSWELFMQLLTEPQTFGFEEADVGQEAGAIFADGLHPTTAVHEIIARELVKLFDERDRSL